MVQKIFSKFKVGQVGQNLCTILPKALLSYFLSPKSSFFKVQFHQNFLT